MNKEFYAIVNEKNLLVQTWSFSYNNPCLTLCKDPEWALKFATKESAQNRINYFIKNKMRNANRLSVIKLECEVRYYE